MEDHIGSSKDANNNNIYTEMDLDEEEEEEPSNAEILNELGHDMLKYFCNVL